MIKNIFTIGICLLAAQPALQAQSSQDTPEQKAQIELGRRLFYDADLSINGTMSCATCHEQRKAFADGNQAHPGALDDPGKRNVPGLANIGAFKNLTWAHNRLSGLAEQSLMPMRGTEPVEMGMNGHEAEIGKRLGQNECYQKLFLRAFPNKKGSIDINTVSRALESFQKTFVSNQSLYDQMTEKGKPLPTQKAQRGKKLFFGAAKCNTCHRAPLFSDDDFHQVQPKNPKNEDRMRDNGLSDVTGNPKDKNLFRTPSLRNAALTAPYWHDGSAKTLADAIRKHDVNVHQTLNHQEIDELIAFIDALSDTTFVNNPKYAKPAKECPY
ncbi:MULTISPECIES: cytochrome-c peroxidase [unclassified Sulfuricurvum]|uniref:cytochrome-c peroxidase n=1 Tax=unclassified Sulfuricurvum TaxID=2632390 RepID=UPI000A91D5A7|nr:MULTISPECIES: cytochrome c peroxidase [unclassified Sulfuricurvum]